MCLGEFFLIKNTVNKSFKFIILACFLWISVVQAEENSPVDEKLSACLMSDGKSWNECFSGNTSNSVEEIANPYSDIIDFLSEPAEVGIISPSESIRNSLSSTH